MDERVEEVNSINRIRPVRKLSFTGHRRERRELKYQLSQYQKAQKPKVKNTTSEKISDGFETTETTDAGAVLDSNDFVGDMKKRIIFDRAMILGD
jgi:hypothetical protein